MLDLIVVEYLDRGYGNQHGNGFISEERDKLVNDEALILFAEKIDLRELIRVKREDDWAKPTLRERFIRRRTTHRDNFYGGIKSKVAICLRCLPFI